MEELLRDTAERATRYLAGLEDQAVAPTPEAVGRLAALAGPFPDGSTDPATVLALLDVVGSPATVASAGAISAS